MRQPIRPKMLDDGLAEYAGQVLPWQEAMEAYWKDESQYDDLMDAKTKEKPRCR